MRGSTGGIGYAIALTLAREGVSVAVNGRATGRVSSAVDRIRKASPGAQVSGVAADLPTDEGIEELFRQVPETDILVNNLGVFEDGVVLFTRLANRTSSPSGLAQLIATEF